MERDIRELAAPPEADLIKLARKAAGLGISEVTAAVRAAGVELSDTYLRDIERGHGGRRGKPAPSRASDLRLAHIARAVGVTPAQLRDAARDHPDGEIRARTVRQAARVLEEMLRREGRTGAAPLVAAEVDGALPMDDDWAAAFNPRHEDIRARIEVARGAYPDLPRLPGPLLFPASPGDAHLWDRVVRLSGSDEAAARDMAIVLTDRAFARADRQDDAAAR